MFGLGGDRMTNKEAIETINIAMAEVEWNYPMDYTVAFEMAIDALEKQVQKKPIKTKIATLNKSPEAVSRESIHCCPRCESNLAPQYKYCPQCGLEIDWGEDDDE